MANIKISELNPLLTVEDADVLPIVDNGVTKKVTAAILQSYTQGNSVLLTGAQTIAGIKTFTSQLASTVATGTAPFSVASTTKVTNLNADLLDGLSSADFQATLSGTGIVKSTAGTISYLTDNSTNWNTAYNDKINSAAVTGSGTNTLTLTQQDAGTITATWVNGTLIREIRNNTGATLTKGTIVYISGATGNKPTVSKAIATGDSTSAQTFGFVQENILNNANGYVVVIGDLTGVDTSAFTEGAQLYLSATTAGEFTATKQYAPAHLVYVGIVTRSHPTLGQIEVNIQNGYEMDELHNVSAQNPSNGDILQFVTSTGLWTKVAGTTSNISEGTNLYFTNARSRSAFSESVTGLDYNSTTGVLSTTSGYGIPTTASQTTWDTAYNDSIVSAAVTGTTTKTLTLNQQDGGSVTASWTDDNTDAVSSVFGRTGAVVAASGDYTTTQVTEGTNLYYTAARFNTAFSGKTTTDLTEGTNLYYTEARVNANTNVAANTAARHNAVTLGTANGLSLSTQALSLGLASGSATGALSSTDWTTFNNKQNALTNPITGTGTTNYLPKFTGASALGNSTIFDNGTSVGIGTASPFGGAKLQIKTSTDINIAFQNGTLDTTGVKINAYNDAASLNIPMELNSSILYFKTGETERMRITSDGNVGIGTSSPSAKLEVKGGQAASKDLLFSLSKVDYGVTSFYQNYSNTFYTNGKSLEIEVEGLPLLQLAVNNAGSASKVIFPNGNVGIGTTSPAYKLVVSNGGALGLEIDPSSNSGTQVEVLTYNRSAGAYKPLKFNSEDFGFITASTERLTIKNNGNIGIGTTTDAGYKLDVNGTARVQGALTIGTGSSKANIYLNRSATTSIENAIRWQTNGTDDWYLGSAASGANSDLEFYNYGIGAVNLKLSRSTGAATFSSSVAIGNTVITAAAVASTHKVEMVIGGVTYYLLATT